MSAACDVSAACASFECVRRLLPVMPRFERYLPTLLLKVVRDEQLDPDVRRGSGYVSAGWA